jgi:hypothetical protein
VPYEITKRGDMFEVVDDNGKRVGEHPTRKQATAQLRALYANAPEAKEERDEFYDNDVPISGMKEITEKGGPGSGRYPKGSGEGGTSQQEFEAQTLPAKKLKFGDRVAWLGDGEIHSGVLSSMSSSGKPIIKKEDGSSQEVSKDALRLQKGALRPREYKESSIVDRVLSFLKEGRRNSTDDASNLQQIHDLAVANGADCMFSIKEVNGAYRWVLLSSNSFQDTDREIVSLKALEADVARTDKEGGGNYGPLRWWHMGNPDPILRVPGAGVDIGVCDFRAMQGRTLIESGTFKDKRVALALKNRADDHLASIGFFHPMTEPDTHGVYSTIQIFERSVLPRLKASNQLTALTVKNEKGDIDMATMSEKWKEFVAVLGGDEALAKSVVKQAQDTEAQADSAGLKFKEGEEVAPVVAEEKGEKPVFEKGKKPVFPKGKTDEEEPDGDEEDGEAKPEEVDKFKKKFMPAVKKEINEMIAASRKETTEKEAGLEAQIVALTAQLKEQQNVIMTLAGDMPRGVRNGYRASLAESTLTKKESPNQPQADPLSDMYSWMTNSLAGHPGA